MRLPATLRPVPDAQGNADRILVVDDDPDIRQLLLDRLNALGYRPRAVADGWQALEAMLSERLGGVVLDTSMG